MTKFIDVKVPPEFWASNIMPEGVIDRWLVPGGSSVKAGDPVATVLVEGMLHILLAPCAGSLQPTCKANSVVDPGFVIGRITVHEDT